MTAPGVRAVMRDQVTGIVPAASSEVALRLMAGMAVRHLPVIVDGSCVGVVHESDLLWHAWATGSGSTLVETLMRPLAPAVPLSAGMREAAAAMVAAGSDVVLVLDGSRIEGILTATDLVRFLAT
ncbi:CBS domain-containing protein [Actinokineospora sp. NBRC 105648]|uniref:CBS domain-containing protein n=1 Tax=Actinokineospora sp. NBRC 105648 TaxID=3032206 RepID=UPI0024A471E1|nr:CBS domain-containing protein [Actinokineospora sp. NBRC 105648]GLZ36684.1 hypothetical protein Acsp05_03090 [Actinokineospora sp. NBRC 105648]